MWFVTDIANIDVSLCWWGATLRQGMHWFSRPVNTPPLAHNALHPFLVSVSICRSMPQWCVVLAGRRERYIGTVFGTPDTCRCWVHLDVVGSVADMNELYATLKTLQFNVSAQDLEGAPLCTRPYTLCCHGCYLSNGDSEIALMLSQCTINRLRTDFLQAYLWVIL